MNSLISTEAIASRIYTMKGRKVILDSDLAELYGVPTKRLNEQVRRDIERFPDDFKQQARSWRENFASHNQLRKKSKRRAGSQ